MRKPLYNKQKMKNKRRKKAEAAITYSIRTFGVPTIEFTSMDSFLRFLGDYELLQNESCDANARLFVKDDVVAKIYVSNPEMSRKNIDILSAIVRCADIQLNQYIVFPLAFLSIAGKLIGYTMPYVDGRTLETSLSDSAVPYYAKIDYLAQLASAINSLPSFIHFGDLHPRNVIVDHSGRIHLIDIDGFSIDELHSMTCPLQSLPCSTLFPSLFQNEKYEEQIVVSSKTDNMCLMLIVLNFLLSEKSFMYFSGFEQKMYLLYLYRFAPRRFVKAVIQTFSKRSNHLHPLDISCLAEIDPSLLSFSSFYKASEPVINRNNNAEELLNLIINEHGGGK